MLISLVYALVCKTYKGIDGQNQAYCGFTTLITMTVTTVKSISNVFISHVIFGAFCLPVRKKILSSDPPTFRNSGTHNHPSCHRRLVLWDCGQRHDARVLFLSSNNISLNRVLFVSGAMGVFYMHYSFIFSDACSEILRIALIA